MKSTKCAAKNNKAENVFHPFMPQVCKHTVCDIV